MTRTAEALDRIQTHDLATERVYRDGDTYTLKAHSPIETSGSCPALVYDAEEQTIWSKGGRKHDVEITSFDDDPVDLPPHIEIKSRDRHAWSFGGPDAADAHQRAQIQGARARALIRYALGA